MGPEQRTAHAAVEVSHAVVRSEAYNECLANQAEVLFRADAGEGLTMWHPNSSAAADQLTVVVAGSDTDRRASAPDYLLRPQRPGSCHAQIASRNGLIVG